MKTIEDILTPKERSEAYFTGKQIDRIPCLPMVASSAAHLIGKTIKEFQINASVMADSHIAAYKRFKYDGVGLCTNTSILAEAMGAMLTYPEDDVASCDDIVIKDKKDIEKIKIAQKNDGMYPIFYEAARKVIKEVGDEVNVTIALSGPFTTAATLRGVENFARDMYEDPEFCHKLLRMTTESLKNIIQGIIESGATPGAIGDPVASGSLISPKMFDRFAAPYIKEAIDFLHKNNYSAALHICGKTRKIIENMVQTGADTISIDRVELSLVRDIVNGRATIVGNIDVTDEMLYGPKERIFDACKNAMEIMKNYKGKFILATGCDISPKANWENVDAMMEFARNYKQQY
jgi:uroporphyrinogen decarboxylase